VDARGSKNSVPGLVAIPMDGPFRTVGVAVATVIEGEGPRCWTVEALESGRDCIWLAADPEPGRGAYDGSGVVGVAIEFSKSS
jgi:hypothetical protein